MPNVCELMHDPLSSRGRIWYDADMKKSFLSGEILTRGVEEVIVRDHLDAALKSGKKLRVKFGIDPTAPHLHLGHTVPLRKLRQFQDAGHRAVLIIGDFTATVGDPSGRSEARVPLSEKDVAANMKKYLAVAGKILDIKKTEVRYNSEWYKKTDVAFLYDLLSKITVQQALEREDFQKRIREGHDVSIIEMVYPLLQGYDSVAVDADVEIGGTDQKFNLLMGRKIQRRFGMDEQDVVTVPLLEGTDGMRKMSKSVGNIIALQASPADMFGGVMSVPDEVMKKYFILLTDTPTEETETMHRDLESGTVNPRDVKLILAERIVNMYCGKPAAKRARDEFMRVFSKHGMPAGISRVAVPRTGTWDPRVLLVELRLASSKSQARRLIDQGAVEIDGVRVPESAKSVTIEKGMTIRVGKRKFVKVA